MLVIANRLKEARIATKLTQEQLGILAGIDEASASARMNQYERGRHVPDFSLIEHISKVLNLPEAYFYTRDDDSAQLLIAFHRASPDNKKKIMAFIDGVTQSVNFP